MPAETVHHPSQSQAPEKPQFIVPEEHVKGNVRETIDFGDMKNGQRSDKYNTSSVNLDDEYNAFYQSVEKAEAATEGEESTVETHGKALEALVDVAEKAENEAKRANDRIDAMEKIQLELLNRERELRAHFEAKGGLAEDQPRRVRKQDGVTEKLVKYADGSFDWQIIDVDTSATVAEVAAEKPGTDLEVSPGENEEATADDDIVDAEIVTDDELDQELTDIGELKAIDAAPVRQAIEAAPERPAIEAAQKAEFVASSESYKQVLDAMDKYAEITAGKRQGYLGHFLEKSKWLVKIPGMQKLGDWANDRADAKIREARADYETAARGMLDELKQFQAEQEIEDSKERRAEIRAEKLKLLTDMDTELELKIVSEQLEDSGKGAITKKFVDWWVRQEGLGWKGNLKKALAVAAVGGAAGLAVGAFGLSLPGLAVGAVAGAAAGGGLMANVTKRRAGGITQTGETLAEARSNEDMEAKQAAVETVDTDALDVANFTDVVENRTRDEQIRNRARINKGKGVGALAGGAGSALGGAIREGINGIANAAPQPEAPTAPKAVGPELPKTPEFQGLNFDVQDGSGYTQELMDFAQANGHALSPDQSWQLHQDIMNQFGQDYININGDGNDIYLDNGDVRLTETGSGEWAPGVADFIKNWMTTRGLW